MKPVLIRVSRTCESSWIPIGQASQVRVHGLEGGSLVKLLFGDGVKILIFDSDGEYSLPEEAEVVKARAEILSGVVSVDLE